MGCTQMKQKKQNHQQDLYRIADSKNTQHQENQVSIQLANCDQMDELDIVQQYTKGLAIVKNFQRKKSPNNYLPIEKLGKQKKKNTNLKLLVIYQEKRENVIDSGMIIILDHSEMQALLLALLKNKEFKNENKSMKTLERKTSDNLVRII